MMYYPALGHSLQQKKVGQYTLVFSTSPLDIAVGEEAEVLLLVREEGSANPVGGLDVTIKLAQRGPGIR